MSLTKESVIVITGAASGIGRALAVRPAQETVAGIAISDVNAEALAETAALIDKANLKVTTHRVNVAIEESVLESVLKRKRRLRRIA
ncbi:MAG TPA: SDR family NAD(P)-dependent oxidoreductase [Pyrinomonadaceae bacterium]|nr:SDR family NAD(P)-dependent oxidoreductase [Pyrinomonadaceae bacterium]